MKNETYENLQSTIRLTPEHLKKLKNSGYRYVQIRSYTSDRREDYMAPDYYVLTPIKDFSDNPDNMEIYESINSPILKYWSRLTDDELIVLVTKI